ncbi:MAG: FAD-dependent oxidoreductase [Polyangiales bacterium]
MKIAVVGTGISGMVAAWLLQPEHEITVFEARDRIGGHTNTVDVELEGRHFAVDTGFIVHNPRTYPNLIKIFDELGVATAPTEMSFSVLDQATGLEYSSQALLARRRNVVSPRMLLMVRDILRFNREAPQILADADHDISLRDLLRNRGYSQPFVDLYIVPMGAAIWSTDPERMLLFPAQAFVRFLMNHRLTSLADRPEWRVVQGGSHEYVKKLTRSYSGRIRVRSSVERIARAGICQDCSSLGWPPVSSTEP